MELCMCLQWDLVCKRAYLKDLTQTILIVGVMFGAMICTTLADKFGRKPIFLFSQWAMIVVGVANAFAPNYYVFAVFRFFTGVFQQVIVACTNSVCIGYVEKQPQLFVSAITLLVHT